MSRLRVESFTISLDGYGAGVEQSETAPMGVGGERLHPWLIPTRTFRGLHFNKARGGEDEGETGVDDQFAARGFAGVGAWVMGRHMFGPVRGPWPDLSWRGWWGEVPPYHCDVYVLTHHAREPLVMDGGTTFHFVTDGLETALERARISAAGRDVRLGGGVSTIRQGLLAGFIDEMHLAITPVLLGQGESLFSGLDLPALGYTVREQVAGERATHVVIGRD
ncbi:MAG: dihydrofolate reductase family protein [Gemmatimonadetes bacterium]|nr:dihydrofolate reductase family protein [Gemmatimonadota bacterium]